MIDNNNYVEKVTLEYDFEKVHKMVCFDMYEPNLQDCIEYYLDFLKHTGFPGLNVEEYMNRLFPDSD